MSKFSEEVRHLGSGTQWGPPSMGRERAQQQGGSQGSLSLNRRTGLTLGVTDREMGAEV